MRQLMRFLFIFELEVHRLLWVHIELNVDLNHLIKSQPFYFLKLKKTFIKYSLHKLPWGKKREYNVITAESSTTIA